MIMGRQGINIVICLIALILSITLAMYLWRSKNFATALDSPPYPTAIIDLPEPVRDGGIGLYTLLNKRRTERNIQEGEISIVELGQLLWAAQGVTDPRGFRTAPSAGALFPLELYVIVVKVPPLAAGTYRYQPHKHQLQKLNDLTPVPELAMAALGQEWVSKGNMLLLIAGVQDRVAIKYGDRAFRYMCLEAGHAAQNFLLAATGLQLATSLVGAFNDRQVKNILGLPEDHTPLYLISVGRSPKN